MAQHGESIDCSDKEKTDRIEGPRKEFNFWTDQEVWFLLDAYEEKWNQLDRGNVKSKHWEEIANRLAQQSSGLWAAKTPTQCKNKIEDMKKKYRAEKAMKNGAGSCSKWVFYTRMESMLRNTYKPVGMPGGMDNGEHTNPVMDLDSYHLENLSFRVDKETEDEDGNLGGLTGNGGNLGSLAGSAGNLTGLLDGDLDSRKRRRHDKNVMTEVVSVIRSFGESLLRIEEAQVQMQREIARLNAEAEARRMEMEAKRTEMMLNTQVQIAKLFANKPRKKKATKVAMENGGTQNADEQHTQV